MIQSLAPGKVFCQYGPVGMVIDAKHYDQPMTREVHKAASNIPKVLESLVSDLSLAKKRWPLLGREKNISPILRLMFESVSATGDESLTPMAAVAGAFADITADYLVGKGGTKIIVNNGGDIAIRLGRDESLNVGISPRTGGLPPKYLIRLSGKTAVGGVATSGFGGRSLTLGVADAAVALCRTAAFADACATVVANHAYVVCPEVKRQLARKLDPNSDIPDLWVTTDIEQLPDWAVKEALSGGMNKAAELIQKGLMGAALLVAGKLAFWPKKLVQPIRKSHKKG